MHSAAVKKEQLPEINRRAKDVLLHPCPFAAKHAWFQRALFYVTCCCLWLSGTVVHATTADLTLVNRQSNLLFVCHNNAFPKITTAACLDTNAADGRRNLPVSVVGEVSTLADVGTNLRGATCAVVTDPTIQNALTCVNVLQPQTGSDDGDGTTCPTARGLYCGVLDTVEDTFPAQIRVECPPGSSILTAQIYGDGTVEHTFADVCGVQPNLVDPRSVTWTLEGSTPLIATFDNTASGPPRWTVALRSESVTSSNSTTTMNPSLDSDCLYCSYDTCGAESRGWLTGWTRDCSSDIDGNVTLTSSPTTMTTSPTTLTNRPTTATNSPTTSPGGSPYPTATPSPTITGSGNDPTGPPSASTTIVAQQQCVTCFYTIVMLVTVAFSIVW
jgi:hypothetical protein